MRWHGIDEIVAKTMVKTMAEAYGEVKMAEMHDNSSGTKREIDSARNLTIPVFDDIDELDQYCCMRKPKA